MDVVALDRELADPEHVLEAAVDERLAQDRAELEVAQPGDVAPDALGDMNREPRLGHVARGMGDAPSARRRRRTASSLAGPAVLLLLRLLEQLLLPRTRRHLD